MRIGLSAGRTARSLDGTNAPSVVVKQSMIRICRSSPASRALCAVSLVVAIGSRPKANATFKEWELPIAIQRVRKKLERQPGGDCQMVDILGAVLTDGLDAVDAACAEALSHNVHSAGVVLNILARHREPPPPLTITNPDALKLDCEPEANCDQHDSP